MFIDTLPLKQTFVVFVNGCYLSIILETVNKTVNLFFSLFSMAQKHFGERSIVNVKIIIVMNH